MVGWYDPGQLAANGIDVAISTIFGRESDYRLLETVTAPQPPYFECDSCVTGEPVWIDYVADAGDGWNSTYSVAYWISRPELAVATADQKHVADTRSGHILIFGGDEVYPVASRTAYQERLVAPYEAARAQSDEPCPELYAIPGNHDWYDNLVSFTRLFCAREWFAGWRTRQKRSYFALKLPYGWWLIGTDIQLGSDIDAAQLDYFKNAAQAMKPDDRVILCTPEPHWIYAEMYRKTEPHYYNEKLLSFLESPRVFGDRIQLFLAGDLHHYRRHEGEHRRQKITAGGGGAALHPTHGPRVELLTQDLIDDPAGGAMAHSVYEQKKVFPDVKTSARLTWRNLLFPFLNWKFGLLMGALYVMIAWSILPDIWQEHTVATALHRAVSSIVRTPAATFLVAFLLFGFIFFTNTHYRWFRWIGGGTHSLLHLAASFFIGWGAGVLTQPYLQYHPTSHMVIAGMTIFLVAWFAGPTIFGAFLLVSLNVFHRLGNMPFLSLRIEDYKNFLRIRLDTDGSMTIFPIGITKVAKRWKASSGGKAAKWEPDGDHTPPSLIEEPIVMTPSDLRR